MKLLSLLFASLMYFLPQLALAQEVSPDTLVRNVTNEVLDIVRSDKDIQSGNQTKTIALVEEKVLPHFNFQEMTRIAMARDWSKASEVQKKALETEFRTLLVHTYSKALNEYKTQTISFKPFKLKPGSNDARVRTQVNQAGAKPITLDYFLQKFDNRWQVYDIEVGGISLVTNYRDFFTSEVRKGGVDGLISALKTKNSGTSK